MKQRYLRVRVLIVSSTIGFLACGGSEPPPVTAEVAKAQPPPPPPPPDLGAVPQPAELVFFGRVSKPSEALRVVGGWTRLPMPGSEVAAEMLTGERTGKLVDLDQPVDLAFATDAQKHTFSPTWAVAAAVLSLDGARSALSARYKLVPGDNGATVISGLGGGDGDADDDGHPRACELAPAAGASPARLVCASSDAALRALAPFLTRTTPRRTIASDIHMEMHFEPVRGFITLGKAMMPGMLAGALGVRRSSDPAALDLIEAATAEVADLGTDLDGLTVDAKLDDAQARVDGKASFKTTASLTARMGLAHPDRADVPPPGFWHLPVDTDLALFNRGLDTKDIERPRDLLLKALSHALEKEGLAEADRTLVTDALTHLFTSPAATVLAKGVDVAATQLALDSLDAAKDDAARDTARRTAVGDALGWWLVGLDEPPVRVQGALKELAAVWNRPSVAKWMKASAKGGRPPTVKIAAAPVALKLPKETTHLEITVYPDSEHQGGDSGHPADAPKTQGGKGARPAPPSALDQPFKLHAFAVPDAGHVWLVIGADEALLASKTRAALSTSPASDTLSARPGLEALKEAHASSGGFMTVRSVLTGLPDAVPGAHPRRAKSIYAALGGLPDQGRTPIPITVTPALGGADAPAGSVSVAVLLSKPAIEGIVRAIVLGGFF
jgi:hypothetical protein